MSIKKNTLRIMCYLSEPEINKNWLIKLEVKEKSIIRSKTTPGPRESKFNKDDTKSLVKMID